MEAISEINLDINLNNSTQRERERLVVNPYLLTNRRLCCVDVDFDVAQSQVIVHERHLDDDKSAG